MARVTVIMPTYNVAPWVEEAVLSVLGQTYTDFKLLIVDDCSTDDTLSRISQFDDPRITTIKNSTNLGLADNLNRALEFVDTELVARMDGDDIAEADWLSTGVNILDSMDDIDICSFGFEFFGTKRGLVRFPEYPEDAMVQMLFGCTVIVPVLRYSFLKKHNLHYRATAFPAEDYMMWAECLRFGRVYNVQQSMFHYRTHPTQISTSLHLSQVEKADAVRLYMLEWLNPSFSASDRDFFLHAFVPALINDVDDIYRLDAFLQKLCSMNVDNHFSPNSLRTVCGNHISLAILDYVERTIFAQGYSPWAFVSLLKSGLCRRIPARNCRRIFVKCLLFRQK